MKEGLGDQSKDDKRMREGRLRNEIRASFGNCDSKLIIISSRQVFAFDNYFMA